MVVEELQILIGCDASTAEKILTSLEERLARFMKQAGAAFSDTKTIRAQGAAEREALKTEAARAKYAAQIEKSNASILQTKQRMEQAEQRLQQKVKKTTIDYEEQAKRFAEIERMKAEEAANRPAGGYEPPAGGKPISEYYKQQAEDFKRIEKEMQSIGEPQIDSNAAEVFLKNANAAEQYNMKLDLLKQKLQRLLGEEAALADGGTGKALERVRGQILSVTAQIQKMQEKAGDPTAFNKMANNAKRAGKKAENIFSRLGSAVKKILSRMIIWRTINGIIQSIEQGFQNMAQASEKANATLSDLQSSFTLAKNSIASAFMPVLQSIAPLLNRVAVAIANFANSIGALFAKLRGDKTFTKAVYVQQDFAAGLNKSNKAAKELKGTLAGFDQINLIQQNDGGAGAAADAVGGMFEEADVESNLGRIGNRLFDFFDKIRSKIPQSVIDRFVDSLKRLRDAWNAFWDSKLVSIISDFVASIIALGASTVITVLATAIENLAIAFEFLANILNGDFIGALENVEDFFKNNMNTVLSLIESVSLALGLIKQTVDEDGNIVSYGNGKKVTETNRKNAYGAKIITVEAYDAKGTPFETWLDRLREWAMKPTEKQVLLQAQAEKSTGFEEIAKWWTDPKYQTEKQKRLLTAEFKIGGENGETLAEGWQRFKQSFMEGWAAVEEWWENSALKKWWTEKVAPWFTKEKWESAGEKDGVKAGIQAKWEEVVAWWESSAIGTWFNEKVAPWFTKEKWESAMGGIKTAWENIWKGAVNAAIEKINRFIDWVNDKLNIKIEPLVIMGKTIIEGGNFQLFKLNKIPMLADGGIAYGDTLARVGEYANARTNPEVIAPLDKLQSMLGNQKDIQTIISLLKRIAEQDTELALYPSAKLGRIASQSIKMYNATVGAV